VPVHLSGKQFWKEQRLREEMMHAFRDNIHSSPSRVLTATGSGFGKNR